MLSYKIYNINIKRIPILIIYVGPDEFSSDEDIAMFYEALGCDRADLEEEESIMVSSINLFIVYVPATYAKLFLVLGGSDE